MHIIEYSGEQENKDKTNVSSSGDWLWTSGDRAKQWAKEGKRYWFTAGVEMRMDRISEMKYFEGFFLLRKEEIFKKSSAKWLSFCFNFLMIYLYIFK